MNAKMKNFLRATVLIGASAASLAFSNNAAASLVSTGAACAADPSCVNGTVDPNWTIRYLGTSLASAAGASGTSVSVVTGWPIAPAGPWLGADGMSTWITPGSDVSSRAGVPVTTGTPASPSNVPGYYNFNVSFSLSNPAAENIYGAFAVDNELVTILVNNQSTGITLGTVGSPSGASFSTWTAFDLTPFSDFFMVGDNQITFQVYNDSGSAGNPVGLRVEIPEPDSLALMGLALVGLGFFATRKRKQA